MKLEQISVNLYTLRDQLKTPANFVAGIARLSAIGFRSVQLSGVAEDLLSPAEFMRVCSDHGITITATHAPSDKLLADPQSCLERLQQLGVTQTAYPYPKDIDLSDEATVDRWLEKLESARQLMQAAGITLSYHNHHLEFSKVGGKTVIGKIFDQTKLGGEIDTYWVQLGGGHPLEWVQRFAEAGRLPLIHLKDVRVTAKGETQFAEVGAGTLDFAPIIATAEAGGCQSYIIEQDQTYGRDPFESVAESFHYLKANFVR